MARGYNTKGGSNGHFNHVDPRSAFLLRLSLSLLCSRIVHGNYMDTRSCVACEVKAYETVGLVSNPEFVSESLHKVVQVSLMLKLPYTKKWWRVV
jgi:hypothetical protein